MIPHFTLQRGKLEYLIIRMGDEFHIIDCDEALTREKRFAILESGCTPAQMQEMGLSGMTIPKSDIKELTVTGCGFQDDVIFYLNNRKKLAFWFPQAYEQRKVDDFFRGIPRKMVKTRYRFKGGKNIDWRIREQNFELYQKLRPVGWVFNILCAATILVPLLLRRLLLRPIGWCVIGLSVVAIGLDLFLPEYFTIMSIQDSDRFSDRKYGQRKPQTRAINIGFGLFCAVGFFALACGGEYCFFDDFRVLPVALISVLVIGIPLLLFVREFMEYFTGWLVTLVLILIFNGFAFIPHFNHVLGPELTSCTATVVDTHSSTSSKGHDRYYCDVVLPDGRELDVEVSGKEYDAAEPGDTMTLQVGTGFFGIDYAIDG